MDRKYHVTVGGTTYLVKEFHAEGGLSGFDMAFKANQYGLYRIPVLEIRASKPGKGRVKAALRKVV